ncbi:bifunctional riboflavin kinase/FAD synthetase [Candidatus Pandoraea novymonadis]|uniref:Riboflavin biosynthesis protein n=1 Tax=Candidatus Pandoraea novymonadis TaxID=1808959 RepID=A0ABX5FDN4_9BURK|nr:bifunctional riboflavin kinase/FAD synthetase [Candidatus Pandoraea novymonadis]PSB91830.1 Riboflavin biosynthesis protein RibF [Candidatus Pandoraea novymonadis]
MRVFRGLPNQKNKTPCVLTIGNFDGVHLGHQALLARLRAAAVARSLPLCVMTFEPHPREYFSTQQVPSRISNLRDKIGALCAHGVDRIVIQHFNAHFAAQSPEDFLRNLIQDGLHTRLLLVGDDFRFGAKRSADFAYLKEAGQRYDFVVEQMPTIMEHTGTRISSSEVRSALASGHFDHVNSLLGRPYTISGHVIHGMKLGRQLGFPTLNLRITHRYPALMGIFVVQVHGISKNPLPAVASLGLRPTINNSGRILLEVHLLDYVGEAYGMLVHVEFLKKLREEKKFNSLKQLQCAIAQDTQKAHAYFSKKTTSLNNSQSQRDFATSATDRIR